MSGKEAVKWMNEQMSGFDETDPKSPLGLTISMASLPKTFFGNIYCSKIFNPRQNTKCFNGAADCRWSASLCGSKIMYHNKTGRPMMGMDREVGFVFNSTGVEASWNKCSYIWDGASNNRYNRGCGPGATPTQCSNKYSAFGNINPKTGKVCTAEDPNIKNEFCTAFGGAWPYPDAHDMGTQCVIPGSAIDYHEQSGYKPSKENNLRTMVMERLKLNKKTDSQGNPNSEQWNEVVLDQELLLPQLFYDPSSVIVALMHRKSNAATSRQDANQMKQEFTKLAFLGEGVDVPLVMFDDESEDPKDPVFVVSEEESEVEMV